MQSASSQTPNETVFRAELSTSPVIEEHYLGFEDVFGKPISTADQPSLVAVPSEEQKQTDRDRSPLVATKVRSVIVCGECSKPRCIYANSNLTKQQEI